MVVSGLFRRAGGGSDTRLTRRLLPKALVDVSQPDLSVELHGKKIDFPVVVAPCAMQCLSHPEGVAPLGDTSASRQTRYITSLSRGGRMDVGCF